MKKEKPILDEKLKTEFKSIVQESLISNDSILESGQKLKDTETVKVIINELLGVKTHLPSTTNLTKKQVHGISKLKTLNKIFKSPLIDEYIYSIEELKRSETSEPFNMLKGFFDLANNINQKVDNELTGIERILGKKGR